MSWNYRVVQRVSMGETYYVVEETYYDDDGQPNGFCEANPHSPESVDDLKDDVMHMLEAFNKPMLTTDGVSPAKEPGASPDAD